MKYKVHRIWSDMFRIYPNRRQSGYDVKSIHTTVPRMCRNIDEAVRTLHILLDLKHEAIPGAFMNQIRRNHPDRIWIRDLKKFRIKEFAVQRVDSIIPNWRIYDLTDHKVIAYLDTAQEALQFLHEYYEGG